MPREKIDPANRKPKVENNDTQPKEGYKDTRKVTYQVDPKYVQRGARQSEASKAYLQRKYGRENRKIDYDGLPKDED